MNFLKGVFFKLCHTVMVRFETNFLIKKTINYFEIIQSISNILTWKESTLEIQFQQNIQFHTFVIYWKWIDKISKLKRMWFVKLNKGEWFHWLALQNECCVIGENTKRIMHMNYKTNKSIIKFKSLRSMQREWCNPKRTILFGVCCWLIIIRWTGKKIEFVFWCSFRFISYDTSKDDSKKGIRKKQMVNTLMCTHCSDSIYFWYVVINYELMWCAEWP